MDYKKVRTCIVCGKNRICYTWWSDILDMPVWMCKQDIALVKEQKENRNNAIKEEQLWSTIDPEGHYRF